MSFNVFNRKIDIKMFKKDNTKVVYKKSKAIRVDGVQY